MAERPPLPAAAATSELRSGDTQRIHKPGQDICTRFYGGSDPAVAKIGLAAPTYRSSELAWMLG